MSNIKIQNNVIGPNTNTTLQDGNAGRMGITVSKWSGATTTDIYHNLQIRNNKIFDAKGDGCGILIIGARNDTATPPPDQFKGMIIDNNEITGNHRSGIDFSAGVRGNSADHIKITNNLITNNGWNITDKDNIKWGNGIVLMRMTNQINAQLPWGPRYIDIENNDFSGNEKNGIYIGPVTRDITIRNNVIKDNGRGDYQNNHGYGTWDGIRVDLDEIYQVEELARHPEQGTYSGLKIYDYLTNVVISENTISGNGVYGIRVNKTPLNGPIDARNNWWGTSSGPLSTVSNPSGSGNPVSDNVRFSPWYTSASKTSTRSAASGDGAVLTVSTDNFTTIQRAISMAWPGDTVKVFPGAYDERIIINKSLTLLGATSGVSKKGYAVPADYHYDATKESIISPSGNENQEVVNITTSNVVFDGFVVAHTAQITYPSYPLTNLIGMNNMSYGYTNVSILNNVIGPNTNTNPGQGQGQDGTKGRSGIALYGPSAAPAWYLTIANNKIFDAQGDGCGILLLGSVNSTNQTMTSTLGLTGKYKGSVIDNNTISGNHRSGIELSGGNQGGSAAADHFRITNNTISNNGWGSPSEKQNLKYGNGIVLIHVGSDKNWPYSWGSQYVDILNNEITANEKNGIYIGPINRDIAILNNTIRNNGLGTGGYTLWDGVQVDLDESYHNPTLKNYAFLTNIVLKDNEINASGRIGVNVIQTPVKGAIDARNNWWGDGSGPKAVKNPTGTANGVSENVAFSPWYTNPVKSATQTFPGPVVIFTWTPFEGEIGDVFSFNASDSAQRSNTSIQTYQWNFGDGNITAASFNSLATHAYNKSRVYTVTLIATDFNGNSNQTTRQISVIAKKEAIAVAFNGTSVTRSDGKQIISFNSTTFASGNGTLANTTTSVVIENPNNGWANMTIKGNTTNNAAGDVVIENITEVVLKSTPTVTELSQVGSVTTSIELSLKQLVEAPLQINIVEGANETVTNAFQLVAGTGMNVNAVAYSMEIKGSSLINDNNLTQSGVTLNMSISKDWVLANGGIGAIKVMRYSDGGTTVEPLQTTFLYTPGDPPVLFMDGANYAVSAFSPNGCSVFGVVAVAAAPAAGPSAGSQGSQSGSAGSGISSGGSYTVTDKSSGSEGISQQQPGGDMRAPPGELKGPEPPGGLLPEFKGEILPVQDGQSLSATIDRIADMILSNIMTVAAVLILTVGCTEAIIWYRKKGRYRL
jgi:parallel beta-helix repeat protein